MERAAREVLHKLKQSGQLSWRDSKGKADSILIDAEARRLVDILAAAVEQRESSGEVATARGRLDDELFAALESTWTADAITAETAALPATVDPQPVGADIWLLRRIEAVGFGGLNGASCTKPFVAEFSEGATCVYGGNGSGKTSLISAISWALTGQRLSDTGGPTKSANTPQPIFDSTNPTKQIATWPPVATYPTAFTAEASQPTTKVTLTFVKKGTATEASVSRRWDQNTPDFTVEQWDEALSPVRSCLDVAVEMPLRIGHLRLGENDRLNDAVASLTGLDLITSVGHLVSWLDRANAPFLSNPKKSDHNALATNIASQFDRATQQLPSLKNRIAPFEALLDWLPRAKEHSEGLNAIADELTKTAGEDLKSLETFVAPSIDLSTTIGQQSIANAAAAAVNVYTSAQLDASLSSKCPLLSKLDGLSKTAQRAREDIASAIAAAETKLASALGMHRRRISDTKLTLKAVAADTHRKAHGDAPIQDCILCERALNTAALKALGTEIGRLAEEASLLLKTLEASCNDIASDLGRTVESSISLSLSEVSTLDPIDSLRVELRDFLVRSQSFAEQLTIFGTLFDAKFPNAESGTLIAFNPTAANRNLDVSGLSDEECAIVGRVQDAIEHSNRGLAIIDWSERNLGAVKSFYTALLGDKREAAPADIETVLGVCKTLTRAINDAKPAQLAAADLRSASKNSAEWIKKENTRRLRLAITSAIEPLEKLPKYVEAEIAQQIDGLSAQISKIVSRFHLSATLEFQRARFERPPRQRTGLLRARATPKKFAGDAAHNDNKHGYEIDASLIANTSWMRALLWAFVFSLREERAKQSGLLIAPLMLMDDPQVTFDSEHRCAWIDFMMSGQPDESIAPTAQAIFTSHDQAFVRQIHLQTQNCNVRYITAPSSEQEAAFVSGTTAIDRLWARAETSKQNADASQAISALRMYLEDMTRSIFPRALGATASTLGQLMDELQGKVNSGAFPYEGGDFKNLLKAWKEPSKQQYRDALSEVHHNSEAPYDYVFGKALFAWFNKGLRGQFQKAFDCIRLLREAGWRTPHSGVAVTAKASSDTRFGRPMTLPANLNQLIGRVAAESEGRQVEGQPSLRFVTDERELPDLGALEAAILCAATLEPAAQIGDALLLSSTSPPTENSLVVCHADGAWRARRFGTLGASAEHAVLVANAVNPREIRHPILVELRPENFRKIVGIVYRDSWPIPPVSEDETAEVTDEAALDGLMARSIGRILVIGDSAEPIALQGQYLMSAPQVPSLRELMEYDGRPIVADLGGRILLKRLRLTKRDGPIVLESLDAAGRHPPVIVSPEEAAILGERLRFWPVVGILFDSSKVPS